MQIVVAESTSALRSRIEEFILERYEAVYGARVPGFAPRLVALLEGQRILCAAGLRFSHDVLFTEHYLDEPAEMAIARRVGRSVCRSSVFEVSSLCGTSPSGSIALIRAIARSGFDLGYEWSIFAATGRLRRLVDALGFAPVELAAASRERVPEAASWGRYYETQPVVLAVERAAVAAVLSAPPLGQTFPIDAPRSIVPRLANELTAFSRPSAA